jgi:hypothetical protein
VIQVFEFVQRRPGMSADDFAGHWRDEHATFFAKEPSVARHMRRFELVRRLDADARREQTEGEVESGAYDGVELRWFDDLPAYQAYLREPARRAFVEEDAPRFRSPASASVVTREHDVIVEKSAGVEGAGCRLICILRRKDGWELGAFHEHWRTVHGGLFQDNPGLRDPLWQYHQHHGLDLPTAEYDGVTQQWFASLDEWVVSLGAPEYPDKVNPDVASFLDQASMRFIIGGQPTVVIG